MSTSLDEKRSDSHNEKISDVKSDTEAVQVSAKEVDTAAAVVGAHDVLDPDEARRVLKKIDKYILPLMCLLYAIQYMDKATLNNASVLGILPGAHLSADQYNWLGTIFYVSYLIFEFPQNLALQRFPVAKWMAINIFVWGVALTAHAACNNFAGLMACRFILGVCEGSVTAGFLIVSSMFYTHREQTVRVGYWFLMNGFAQIASGFIAFGVLHIHTEKFAPWKWLMVIFGIITFVLAALFWLFFPDSPTNAWFLTQEERATAVLRVKVNQTGVENKVFKKDQMIEALVDPKTWMFALLSAIVNVPNSLSTQKSLITASFGFTFLQTTLLGCVDGVIEIITIWAGVHIVRLTNQRAYTAIAWKMPNIIGAVLVITLPFTNRIGLLISLWVTGVGTVAFVIALAWLASSTAGHTKRVTTNAIMLIAYCVGNAAAPQMWKQQYKPRNRVPWLIVIACYVAQLFLLFLMRWYMNRENKRRDALPPPEEDPYEHVYVERLGADGVMTKVKVTKEFLDLTDRQNLDFRYPL